MTKQCIVVYTVKTHLTSYLFSTDNEILFFFLQTALVNDQMTNHPDQPRSICHIGDIVQDDIDELSIKLDKVRFKQILANEKGLNPPHKYPYVKKDDDEGKGEQNVQTNVTRCEDKTQVQPKRIVGNVKKT
ncbi:hypothetical protein Hanom_Chr09g00776711 [Helianthus anomalus]